jgi:CubicO group peptidase (beta-lactamase class C family)
MTNSMPRDVALLAAGVVLLAACAPATRPPVPSAGLAPVAALQLATPSAVGMRPDLGATLDSTVRSALAAGAAPGAALAVGRHSRLVHVGTWGRTDQAEDAPAVTDSTLFDLASLTKVVATTTAVMILEEDGRLDLDRPVRDYLPGFDAADKAGITVRMLLAHSAGFMPYGAIWRDTRGREAYLRTLSGAPLAYTPGDSTRYSDWGLILAALVVEQLAGQPLDEFMALRVWRPLGMRDTGFNPVASSPLVHGSDCTAALPAPPARLARIAATEQDTVYRHRLIHGIVHDENACALGGVAGHAGLFSSVRDLAVFAQMMLNGGEYGGVRILQPGTIARWTARQGVRSSRALGWDTPSPGATAGRYFSPRSFGHTGFTGTSMWMDPERGVFVVLLTNRVNPTRQNTLHEPLRRAIADAVQTAITDAPVKAWR